MDVVKFLRDLCESVRRDDKLTMYVSTTTQCACDYSGKFYGYRNPTDIRDLPAEVVDVVVNFTADVSNVLRAAVETVKSHMSKVNVRKYAESSMFTCGTHENSTSPSGFEFFWVPARLQTPEDRNMWISLMTTEHSPHLDIGLMPVQFLSTYDNQRSLVVPVEALGAYAENRDAYLRHVHDVLVEDIRERIYSDLGELNKQAEKLVKKREELCALFYELYELKTR